MKGKNVFKTVFWVVLLAAVLYIGDLFLGNPISYGIVKWHSQKYLRQTYPDQQLQVESIYHDWYSGGGYDVRVISETSRDTRFELTYSRLGRLCWDGYDITVASGRSTWSRLYDEYTALVQGAAEKALGDHSCFAGLSVVDEYSLKASPLPQGIDMSQLELDKDYDVAALGAEYGYISLSIRDTLEHINTEKAAEYLVDFHKELEKQGIGYVTIDLFMIARDTKNPDRSLGISGITAMDLEAEDPAARLAQMRQEQWEYWNGPKTE